MLRCAIVGVLCFGPVSLLASSPPPVANVQGYYEGTCKSGGGEKKIEARVVAYGEPLYKVFVRVPGDGGKVAKIELDGKVEGDVVSFTGKSGDGASGDAAWKAEYAADAIRGTCGKDGKLELKRVVRGSPTLGLKPPKGAIVLLDGKDFSEMTKKPLKDNKEQEWKVVEDGAVQVPKQGMNSKRQFAGSFDMHVEFKINLSPKARGQGRGNSGVYLPNGTEVQVLDSFGMTTYKGGGCGGLYAYKDPDAFDEFSLASVPPLEWQTYDIEYRVQKKDGKVAGSPLVTVRHNGILIHDKAKTDRPAHPGGFHFQDHGNPVLYRNIWVLPHEER